MWKVFGFLAIVSMVGCQELSNNPTNTTSIPSNHSLSSEKSPVEVLGDKKEIVTNPTINREEEEGSIKNPFDPSLLVKIDDDQSLSSFKYYFVLLAVSSVSVIMVIIFKAMRLRKSRAELKYGKSSANDRSEFEPLGKASNKWLEEETDEENEDEIFDINFLKNSRTNMKT